MKKREGGPAGDHLQSDTSRKSDLPYGRPESGCESERDFILKMGAPFWGRVLQGGKATCWRGSMCQDERETPNKGGSTSTDVVKLKHFPPVMKNVVPRIGEKGRGK